MTMKAIKILSVLFIGLTITSCTDIIQLDLEDPQPVLVVDGYISDMDTTQWVRLSNLENYFADGAPDFTVYKTATVKLLEDSIEIATYTFVDSTFRFEIQYKGITGRSYQVDISLPDGKHYVSLSEEMYSVPQIDSLYYVISANHTGPGELTEEFVFSIDTKEPIGLGDSYQWKTYINNNYQFEAQDLNFSNDQFVDGMPIFDFEIYAMDFEQFDDYQSEAKDGRVFLKIEQSKITSRYYDFLFLVFQQTLQVGGPFAAPPAEIKGNIPLQGDDNQYALGYFYTASIHTKEIEVIK